MELNQHLDGLALGGIRRFTALAQERGDCILLTLGEPEFDTPAPIRRACREALDRGLTHYTENRGSLPLRRAISQFERRTRNLDYAPEEILITLGATEAIYTALTGVLNPGDEVIIPTPAFSLYDTVARMAGAVPIAVDTAPTGFQLTAAALEAALSPRTKVLVLNSPNNPTGVIYTPENLQAIDRVLGDRPLFVLCDDVYRGLSPCLTFPQISRRRDRILAVQSFSKPYAMTGWRAGYLMAPQPVLDRLAVLHSHCDTCAPAMVQAACLAALEWDPQEMVRAYELRRAYVCRRLGEMGLPCVRPAGAFYVFPSIASLSMSSEEFCLRLIQEAGVAAVPGTVFGKEGFVRMSCCCSMETLQEAMDRLARFVRPVTTSDTKKGETP